MLLLLFLIMTAPAGLLTISTISVNIRPALIYGAEEDTIYYSRKFCMMLEQSGARLPGRVERKRR